MFTKKELRAAMQSRLLVQSQQDRDRRGQAAQLKLFALPVFQKARYVFFFVSMPEEIDTRPMIDRALASGKRVAIPRADLKTRELAFFEIRDLSADSAPGLYGIREPKPEKTVPVASNEADFIVVPGVVFDFQNYRIGHGAGFYDKFLACIAPGVPKIGLAYSFQVIDEVPRVAHDVQLDGIITD